MEEKFEKLEGYNQKKLYSLKAIRGATFLGGPIAAGYMISENFKTLNKPREGKKSLILSIIFTIVLFGGIFIIPEHIHEKIPKLIIPITYTALIGWLVELKQGEILKKLNKKDLFSGWRAFYIGLISLIITFAFILIPVLFDSDNEVYEKFDSEVSLFTKNESESLKFYEHINDKSDNDLINELNDSVIPKWEENISFLSNFRKQNELPEDLEKHTKILLDYSNYRLEAFKLFKKSILLNTDNYNSELDEIHKKIDLELQKLE